MSLSGDAGDELFCGYNRYELANNLWQRISKFPMPLRASVARGVITISPQRWDSLSKYIPKGKRFNNFGHKMYEGAGVLASRTVDELYYGLLASHDNAVSLIVGGIHC